MEVAARLKGARISAQKARLVADQVRGLPVEKALDVLEFSNKKAAHIVKKVLDSAIANAENNEGADVDELKVSSIYVDEALWRKWMVYVINNYGSSRKASQALEDAMIMRIHAWTPDQKIEASKFTAYKAISEEENPDREYKAELIGDGQVKVYYRLRPGHYP